MNEKDEGGERECGREEEKMNDKDREVRESVEGMEEEDNE